ncbi:hypothetical protein ANTQUA_LOCUS7719 [Anthophora quadrimaculata]
MQTASNIDAQRDTRSNRDNSKKGSKIVIQKPKERHKRIEIQVGGSLRSAGGKAGANANEPRFTAGRHYGGVEAGVLEWLSIVDGRDG